jgi:ATP/maltotriose-dependent transcriptional regulator MalT
MRAIERDFENIRMAWGWSAQRQHGPQLQAMLNALYLFGVLSSRHRETSALFQECLGQPIADAALRGRLLARRWGYLHWLYQADYREALTSVEQALTIALAENDRFEIAFCQLMAAYVLISMQRSAEALPRLEASQALFEELDEPYYLCWVLHRMGYVYYNLKQNAQATAYTEQSFALARASHNRVALVVCLCNLGLKYILNGTYAKGRQYCAEALSVASEMGQQDQIGLALNLVALCAFLQGDYRTCQEYAGRAQALTEEFNRLVFRPFSLSLLILLACLREDYAEGVRLNEQGKHLNAYTMGSLLFAWARAILACGLDSPAEARLSIQKALQLFDPNADSAPTIWLAPCVAYALAETAPEQAVELLAWIFAYPDRDLGWARQWPLLERLCADLQRSLARDAYEAHWELGAALTADSIAGSIQRAFRAAPSAGAQPDPQHLLTAREHEILRLIATGMTNPQIAEQLVISAGTVKTHTLSIYRKLEVANRTQAIIRAQEQGLLSA